MSATLLRCEGLVVEAAADDGSRVELLRGVDFELQRGSLTCVVGESGSGKTLLLRTLLGISDVDPGVTAGRAWFWREGDDHDDGRALFGDRGPRPILNGRAGYVFQHPMASLDPLRRVGAQVGDSVRLRHGRLSSTERKRRSADWLQAVGLPEPARVAEAHPHELSGGMAQRVAVAIALAAEPELLVADEPTTGLDWSLRRGVVELLAGLCHSRGLTLVLISHDFAVVEHVAERVLVLDDGVLVEDGPADAFFRPGPGRHPLSRELQERVAALEDGRHLPPAPPRARAASSGCVFADRCSVRRDADAAFAERCAVESVPLFEVEQGHRVRCWREEPTS